MTLLPRLFGKPVPLERDFLVAQVVEKHSAWFPAHNRGQVAPNEARQAWAERLQSLSERELILLIGDNHARNLVLGKFWPAEIQFRRNP